MLKIGCKQRFDMGSCTDFALPWTSAITRGQAEASLMLSLQSHSLDQSTASLTPNREASLIKVSRTSKLTSRWPQMQDLKYNWHRQQTWKTRSTQSFPLVEVRMMFLCIPDWKNIQRAEAGISLNNYEKNWALTYKHGFKVCYQTKQWSLSNLTELFSELLEGIYLHMRIFLFNSA